jgi:hypothetical protein
MTARPLKRPDLGKRKFWGWSGFLGALAGLRASHFLKSDLWIVGGVVLGLLGGFVVTAIRDSDEI